MGQRIVLGVLVVSAAVSLVAGEPAVDVNLATPAQLAAAGLDPAQTQWILARRPWTSAELAASPAIPEGVRAGLAVKAELNPGVQALSASALVVPNIAAQQRDLVWYAGARPVCADLLLQVFGAGDGPCPAGRTTLPLDEARARGYRDQR